MPSFKILSKRQIQRQAKKKFQLLKQECYNSGSHAASTLINQNFLQYTPPSTSKLSLESKKASDLPCLSHSLPAVSETNVPLPIRTLIPSAPNLLSVNNSPSLDKINEVELMRMSEEPIIVDNLREWISSNKIGVKAVNELLKILRPHHHYLPLDFRTLMKTPREVPTIKLLNGEMFYLGILNQLVLKLKSGLKSDGNIISLQINVDGLPLFKSSATEFYPILALCSNLHDRSPFPIACFCGTGKPEPLETFLRPFMQEVQDLKSNGISFEGKQYVFQIECFICDAPARSYLKGTVGHTSKHGCEKCTMIGHFKNHRITFVGNDTFPPIEDKDFELGINKPFIKTKSPLLEINVKLVSQFPLDPMHLIFLGIVRRLLLNYFIAGKPPYKLSHKQITLMNSKISIIKSYQPSEFSRKCRSLFELKRWKATEYRSFLLYYGIVLLRDVVTDEQYNLFLLLHAAVIILSNEDFIQLHVSKAQLFLKNFVRMSSSVLGEEFVVYNVHSIQHLVDDVRRYGPITHFSCFPFENYLSSLKQSVRYRAKPLQQIYKRLMEKDKHVKKMMDKTDIIKNDKTEFKSAFKYNEVYDSNQVLLSYNCKKIRFTDYIISECPPDNCVVLFSGKVCLIKQITVSQTTVMFEGVSFAHKYDLYSTPMSSSALNIFYCTGISNRNVLSFHHKQIRYKGFLIPYQEGYAFFPLLHIISP